MLHLVDWLGGLQDAIDCAARMAKLKEYRLREYPESKGFFDKVFGGYSQSYKGKVLKEELGEDGIKLYDAIRRAKSFVGSSQTRMPFDFSLQ